MSKAPKEKETEEPLPDHLRCGRTDGRQWRCRRRVKENLKLCEIHYLQGRHRQYKEKVPESLKLQRKRKSNNSNNNNEEEEEKEKPEPNNKHVLDNNVESRARRTSRIVKKKRMLSEDSDASASSPPARKKALKQGDMQLELLRMVLKREAEKNKNKSKNNNKKNKNKKKNKKEKKKKEEKEELCYTKEELRRELPNGVMEISPASPTRDYNNVGSHCDVKVGVDSETVTPRYFRSKNVDRVPAGKLQIVPYGSNMEKGKRKKCHWCQTSESGNLIQCSSCQREFFCMDCVKERFVIVEFT